MNLKRYFKNNQRILLNIINSKLGREVLRIENAFPVTKVTPNSFHQTVDFEGKNTIYQGWFYTWNLVADRLLRLLKDDVLFDPLRQKFYSTQEYNPQYFNSLRYCFDSSNFNPDSGGRGRIRNENVTYSTCRNAAAGNLAGDLGLIQTATGFTINRYFAPFDTSSLPDDATKDSAFIRFVSEGTAKINDDTDSFVIVANTQASNTALVTDDFDQLGTTSYGSMAISAYNDTNGANNDINLSAAGLADISLIGFSKFGVRINTTDIGNTQPAGTNEVRWTSGTVVLSVTYTSPDTGGVFLLS